MKQLLGVLDYLTYRRYLAFQAWGEVPRNQRKKAKAAEAEYAYWLRACRFLEDHIANNFTAKHEEVTLPMPDGNTLGLRLVQENTNEVILARVTPDGRCDWEGRDALLRLKYHFKYSNVVGRLTAFRIIHMEGDIIDQK